MPLTSFTRSVDGIRHNTKIQIYPDGSAKYTYCKKPIFWEKGYERQSEKPKGDILWECEYTPKEDKAPRDRSLELMRRHRGRVRDIALCNDFKYFLTITINPEKIDSFDVKAVKKKLNTWLAEMVRNKDLQYVLIPEYHESGRIHMHALINGALDMVYSGKHDKRGNAIYNCPEWKYGFTTAVRLDNGKMRIANYIMKYITKGSKKIFGKYFWSSKNIQREPKTVLLDTPYDEVKGKEYQPLEWDKDLCFKYADTSLFTRAGESMSTNNVIWTNADGTEEELTLEQVCYRLQTSC